MKSLVAALLLFVCGVNTVTTDARTNLGCGDEVRTASALELASLAFDEASRAADTDSSPEDCDDCQSCDCRLGHCQFTIGSLVQFLVSSRVETLSDKVHPWLSEVSLAGLAEPPSISHTI